MSIRFNRVYLYIFFLCALIFTASACDSVHLSGDSHSDTAVEAGHEGQDHGPGEHGQPAEESQKEGDELDWCQEHSVPESVCTKCNPALISNFKESGDWCAGHDLPESHCRLCNPDIEFPQEEILRKNQRESNEDDIEISLFFRPNSNICATDGALIQFASATTAKRTGISVQTVRESHFESIIEAPAETCFDETESTVITSTVPALVSRWSVTPGDIVREGEVLTILQSPEIAKLKSSLLSAFAAHEVERKELERHMELRKRELISEADFDRQAAHAEKTRTDYISIKGLLLSAGLNDSDIEDILNHGNLSNQFALRAPTSGMVVQRIAQIGEFLEAGKAYAILANPESMWIEASLTEEQLKNVEVGQKLIFGSDGKGFNRVGGEIIWISRFLDPHTRTGTVRAQVIDANHQLHSGEFGRVKILQKSLENVALIPKDAVQWEGCCNVVFVKESESRFRPRKVTLLDGDGPFYQVTDGVKPGDEVVVDGAFLLKTELKKTSLGSGCCGLEPTG